VIGTIDPTPTATWITTTDQAAPMPPARDPVREWIRAMLYLRR
jgi:hypothetical protein